MPIDLNTMGQFYKRAVKLREKMIELGITSANARCVCDTGRMEVVLRGHKQRVEAWCDTCKKAMKP